MADYPRLMSSFAVDAQKVSDLCQKSLDKKWNDGSQQRIFHSCPFCMDVAIPTGLDCFRCLCPPEICKESGRGGYIGILTLKYGGGKKICNIPKKDLDHMRSLFQKYIIPATQEGSN